jgi:sigma-E factor negative regulatory protein RseA
MAAVGALVWGLLGVGADQAGTASGVLAQSQSETGATLVSTANPPSGSVSAGQAGAEPAKMIRDPRLDELLAAHRQFGGVSALQQPAGSLRSVSLVSQTP